jgi:hypothetical protein
VTVTGPLFAVECAACGWRSYRKHPTARPCHRCHEPGQQITVRWVAGQGPGVWRTYLVCIVWPPGWHRDPTDRRDLVTPTGERIRFHAQHYTGKSTNVPQRVAYHAAGNGAGVIRAAFNVGAVDIRLARTWVEPGREFHLKRRGRWQGPSPQSTCGVRKGVARGMTAYCPICKETRR